MHRLRILHLTGLVLTLFGIIWTSSFLVRGAWLIGLSLGCMTLAFAVMLLLLPRWRNLTLFTHLQLALLLMGVCLSNWWTGGLALANDVPLFVMPVVAIFLLGPAGLWWALLSLIAFGVFWGLHSAGFSFPQIIPQADRSLDAVLTWSTALVVVAWVTFTYDRAVRRSARELTGARDRAEESSRAKSQFLANMSHEFRTPLNAIIGLTEVTLQEQLPPAQRRHLEMVKKSAFTLLALVDDVLDMARIEAGRLDLRPVPFEPRRLLAELLAGFRYQAEAKGLALELAVDEQVPRLLRGDVVRLRQVVSNLLDNAIKFTDSGRVDVQLDRQDEDRLQLAVEDTGAGIPADLGDRVFEAFRQGDESLGGRNSGSGLGLAICRELVGLMGGTIRVRSRPGEGSCFEISLPLPPVPDSQTAAAGPRILAAEDDRMGQELLATILRSAGYQVDVVASGAQVVERVQSGQYDLVLMDVRMPGMDGLEAARRIRAAETETDHLPIVALTAHALEQERQRCFEAGMDDFIAKPIEREVLIEALQRWLGPHRTPAGPEPDQA